MSEGSKRGFAAENGWFLLAQKLLGGSLRRVRDAMVARRLGTHGLRIGHGPRLLGLGHMRVGRRFSAGSGLWLEAITRYAGTDFSPLLTIGDDVNLSDSVHIACTNRVTIGDGVLVGSHALITDHAHGRYRGTGQSSPHTRPTERELSRDKSVAVGRNVWIGDGVAVLGGAEIGEGAIIGANSVVTGKIPAFTMAMGTPARPVRVWDEGAGEWVAWAPPGNGGSL